MLNFLKLRSENWLPGIFILVTAIIALNLRFEIGHMRNLAFLLSAVLVMYGVFRPWLLLLSLIVSLFSIEPTPKDVGASEIIIAVMAVLYVLATYTNEIYKGNIKALKSPLISSVIFSSLVLASCYYATNQGVSFADWMRGIFPFLLLYLSIPISITLKEDFSFRIKWVLIACAVLTLLILGYINSVFFVQGFYKIYWLNEDGFKVYNSEVWNSDTLSGPFLDRITLTIQQATSELLPLGLVVFTLVSLFTKKPNIKIASMGCAALSLFAILETYTRSMLLSSIIVLGLVGLWLFFYKRDLINAYLKICTVLVMLSLTFVSTLDTNSVWLGRISVFFKTIYHVNDRSVYLPSDNSNKDDNLLSRIVEYKIAWSQFSKKPLFGAGIGARHDINFPLSNGQYIHKKVGYIHNWIFYWLMVGGLAGVILYSSFIIIPLYYVTRLPSEAWKLKVLVVSIMLTMTFYSLFFAVFRLLTFNLIFAIIWGISFCLRQNEKLASQELFVESSRVRFDSAMGDTRGCVV
ncbi:O-antigen ligase family protein [Legionella dresdenensis]|uniref:O-antigen ligase family protein n=1 Tax=Legionella dresdenensis TaxID=450200 RepID=A0ABV8CCM0_9GAMM